MLAATVAVARMRTTPAGGTQNSRPSDHSFRSPLPGSTELIAPYRVAVIVPSVVLTAAAAT